MNLEKMIQTPAAQELIAYFDSMPVYAQGFVTDCITATETLSQAADKFDNEILEYLKEFRPENVVEWLNELEMYSNNETNWPN